MKYLYLIAILIATSACDNSRMTQRVPVPGPVGPPGESCTVAPVVGGAIITCGATSTVILNGVDGQDGQNGQDAPPTAYSVIEVIDPCGTAPGFNEVLLRLANGQILAHYASGALQFLALIGPGNYMTTDGKACNFTIHANGSVTW